MAADRTGFHVSLSGKENGRPTLVNRRPPRNDFSVLAKHAQPNPFFVNEIANLVEPIVRDELDGVVARPVEFIAGVWRFGDINIQREEAGVLVEATVWRGADPFRKRNRPAIEEGLNIGRPIQRDAISRLGIIP